MRKPFVILLALLGLAALVVALLPMRLVTKGYIPELEAQQVSGTIWNGQLRGVRYQRVPVGDIDAGLSFASLLRGRLEVAFARPDASLTGFAGLSRGERRLRDVDGAVQLPMGRSGFDLSLNFSDVSLVTDVAGRCRAVSGQVSASLANVPVLGTTPPMVGIPRCDGDALRLPLASPQGGLGLDLTVGRRMAWTAELSVLPPNRLVEAAMLVGGFQQAAPGSTPVAGQGALVLPFSGRLARPRP
jgi:general secretion pathway protein N